MSVAQQPGFHENLVKQGGTRNNPAAAAGCVSPSPRHTRNPNPVPENVAGDVIRMATTPKTIDESLELTDAAIGFVDNPHEILARIRHDAPVCRVRYKGVPVWLVTRYADVRQALLDPRLASDPRHATGPARDAPWVFAADSHLVTRNLIRCDPPDHTRLRKAVVGEFSAQRVEALRPHVEHAVHELIDEFLPAGRADLIADFGRRLPMAVISEVLGVPVEDGDRFADLTAIWIGTNADDDGLVPAALTEMREYLTGLVRQKRSGESSRYGVLDRLVDPGQPSTLTEAEIVAMGFLLLVAGFETAANLIGNAVLSLLRNPAQLALLIREPARIGPAIDEFLRFDGPIKVSPTLRFTTAEISLGGVTIPGGGEPVLLTHGAANRDPAQFPDPDRLDVCRDSSRHLAFGHGAHHCLGARLAKLEGEVGLGALLARCRNLALAVPAETVPWARSRFIRGLRELPVTFDPVTVRREDHR